MRKKHYILALDQGSSSTKALLVDREARVMAVSGKHPVQQKFSHQGEVEISPDSLLDSIQAAMQDVLQKAGALPAEVACISLANQGETVIGFDRSTLTPLYPAISWQDRRPIPALEAWGNEGLSDRITAVTGLRLDPYFSASRMNWILNCVPQARALLEQDCLCLATSDTWILASLMQDSRCVTDAATASRTMLWNLAEQRWDSSLAEVLAIPPQVLPEVLGNDVFVGMTRGEIAGDEIPIAGICVDQQAALFGHFCLRPGDVKATFGTGCFILGNIGSHDTLRTDGLLTSVGWRVGGECTYVLDGGIFSAGSLLEWVTRQLRLVDTVQQADALVAASTDSHGVHFIPALAGLAAPYWKPELRGAWHGLQLSSTPEDMVRAAVKAIVFRVKDVINCMQEAGLQPRSIRCDGGMARSPELMQLQADVLGIPLQAAHEVEATAYGAALMGGLAQGFWTVADLVQVGSRQGYQWYLPRPERKGGLQEDYEAWHSLLLKQIET